jgi:enamidase
MVSLAIVNIGKIVSGNIDNPLLFGNTILAVDGIIRAIGSEEILNGIQTDQVVDAKWTTVIPGLIDSHVHLVLGDFAPRQSTLGYLDSAMHGGVTTMISAGEAHTPGRPTDPVGTKALAILAHKSFQNFKSTGQKIHGGALILEKGLVEKDFAEMADAGVWLVGEVGLGSVKTAEDATEMVEWAKKYGMKVHMHTGGTSIPGSSTVTADMVMKVNPTLASHINGGTTAIPIAEVDKLIDETDLPLEIVQCGNPKVADHVVRRLNEKKQLNRIVSGNDAPSGTGIIPLGILRNIVQISSISGIPAEKAIAMATGNTARVFGLNTSELSVGKEADMVIMDAPLGSVGSDALQAIEAGDIPGVSMVIIDGVVRVNVSRNTAPATRKAEVRK